MLAHTPLTHSKQQEIKQMRLHPTRAKAILNTLANLVDQEGYTPPSKFREALEPLDALYVDHYYDVFKIYIKGVYEFYEFNVDTGDYRRDLDRL